MCLAGMLLGELTCDQVPNTESDHWLTFSLLRALSCFQYSGTEPSCMDLLRQHGGREEALCSHPACSVSDGVISFRGTEGGASVERKLLARS